MVILNLFHCPTTETSYELATCLSVEAWEFSTHRIKHINNMNIVGLHELVKKCADMKQYEIDALQTLLSLGFICMYLPNG